MCSVNQPLLECNSLHRKLESFVASHLADPEAFIITAELYQKMLLVNIFGEDEEDLITSIIASINKVNQIPTCEQITIIMADHL